MYLHHDLIRLSRRRNSGAACRPWRGHPLGFQRKRSHERQHSSQNTSILKRVHLSEEYEVSQIFIGWTEETCSNLVRFAAEDHSYTATKEERAPFQHLWKLSLNSSGPNGPMNQRPASAEAVRTTQKGYTKKRDRMFRNPSQSANSTKKEPLISRSCGLFCETEPKTGWEWYSCPSSSSSSWWQ